MSGATALEVTPDGRIFVCEQHGALRLIKDDKLLEVDTVPTVVTECDGEKVD